MSTDEHHTEQIRDPAENDYNQRERLKEIWDKRRRLEEYVEQINLEVENGMQQRHGDILYHRLLRRYIITLQTFFTDQFEDPGLEYWLKTELGIQRIAPPDGFEDVFDPKFRSFTGLKSILETEYREVVAFSTEKRVRHKGTAPIERSKVVTVDEKILDNALIACHSFTSQVGLEAKIGEDDRPLYLYG